MIALQLAVYAANITYPQTSLELVLQEGASAGFWVIISAIACGSPWMPARRSPQQSPLDNLINDLWRT